MMVDTRQRVPSVTESLLRKNAQDLKLGFAANLSALPISELLLSTH
jgi:hypothetical protein